MLKFTDFVNENNNSATIEKVREILSKRDKNSQSAVKDIFGNTLFQQHVDLLFQTFKII